MPEYHEYANIFPMMTNDEYYALVESIRKRGFDPRHPIILYNEQILDGRNRYEACNDLEIEPVYTDFIGTDLEALEFVWEENVNRRHLNSGQKAACGKLREREEGHALAEYKALVEAAAKERQGTRNDLKPGNNIRQTFAESEDSLEEIIPAQPIQRDYKAEDQRKSVELRAKKFGTNRTYVSQIDSMDEFDKEHGTDFVEQVANNETTFREAQRQIRKIIQEETTPELPKGKYRVIYLDPPWQYSDSRANLPGYGPAEDHYPTMSLQELKDLPVKDLAADDCVMFMWSTSPMLNDALELMKSWGFNYKASQIWDKEIIVFGHYGGVQHEILLIGTKGSYQSQHDGLIPSVYIIQRSRTHSEKPEQFRQNIELLYPQGPYIELFARGGEKENWEFWGSAKNLQPAFDEACEECHVSTV